MTENKMSVKQAIRILHPNTTREALCGDRLLCRFRSHEAVDEAVNEACVLAFEIMEKYLEEHGEIS